MTAPGSSIMSLVTDRWSDTDSDSDRIQFDLLRKMTPLERGQRMAALSVAVHDLSVAAMKERHPGASDDEIRLRVAAIRLGRELTVAAYGFDPDSE